MSISLRYVQDGDNCCIEISGKGFSSKRAVLLPLSTAYVRLLAEICGGLAPWLPFSSRESCEQTLFSLGKDKLDLCIMKYQRRLTLNIAAAKREDRKLRRKIAAASMTGVSNGTDGLAAQIQTAGVG